MYLEEGDELVATVLASKDDDVIMVTEQGQSIRFNMKSLLIGGEVYGIRLEEGDKLVSLDVVIPDAYYLVVTANGYGKINPIADYKNQSCGVIGIKTIKAQKSRNVAAARLISQNQQLMLISKDGMAISTPLKDEDEGSIPNRDATLRASC